MKLKTLSASSITTYQDCKVKWYVDYVRYAPRSGGDGPAKNGTVCHGALQDLIQMCFLDEGGKGAADPRYTLDNLLMLMVKHLIIEFNTDAVEELPAYPDCVKMLTDWFGRTEWPDHVEVISVEKKLRMPIKTSQGDVPFTFICDRVDRWVEPGTGKRIIRVVDYKSIREYVSGEDLGHKIQPRAYAMAAAWQFQGEFDEIWVAFDLLRYGCVERQFTREENIKVWKEIRATAERIIADDENKIKPQLSPSCSFCTIKTTCSAVTKNANAGGTMSMLGDLKTMAERRRELEGAMKAAKYALEELDGYIVAEMKKEGEVDLDLDHLNIKLTSSKSTSYDASTVREILGPQMYSQIGTITNKSVDALLKGDELTDQQKVLIRQAKGVSWGDLKPKISTRTE